MTKEEIDERKRILNVVYDHVKEREAWCEMMRKAIFAEHEKLMDMEDQRWKEKAI